MSNKSLFADIIEDSEKLSNQRIKEKINRVQTEPKQTPKTPDLEDKQNISKKSSYYADVDLEKEFMRVMKSKFGVLNKSQAFRLLQQAIVEKRLELKF